MKCVEISFSASDFVAGLSVTKTTGLRPGLYLVAAALIASATPASGDVDVVLTPSFSNISAPGPVTFPADGENPRNDLGSATIPGLSVLVQFDCSCTLTLSAAYVGDFGASVLIYYDELQ